MHGVLVAALTRAVADVANMKVRIQAAQALVNVPRAETSPTVASTLWAGEQADAVIMAVCDALIALDVKSGAEPPKEGKQAAAYLKALRIELVRLGEHWAVCAAEAPGAAARGRLEKAAVPLASLIAEEGHVGAGNGATVGSVDAVSASNSCSQPAPGRLQSRLIELGILDAK